jgi:hypothetical protein
MADTYKLDTTRNPWRIDAIGGALALPLLITTDLVTIDRMEWTSEEASANDEVEVLDNPFGIAAGGGRRLWAVYAAGADSFVWQRQKTARPAQGICINALTSGTILIYYA